MQRRRFGRTNLDIPVLTFGGGYVGGLLIHQPRETAFHALNRAYDAGIDWVDTAASYGNGVSETVIGEWLKTRSAGEKPRISTKFRIEPGEPDYLGQARRSVEASLERLGLSKVEVLFLHNQMLSEGSATPEGPRGMHASRVVADGGVADVMDQLRAEGLCDWIGITALGEMPAIGQVVDSGRIDGAQVYYNMLNPTADMASAPPGWNTDSFAGLLAKCEANDVGTFGIRILAAGRLATSDRHGREVPITNNADDDAETIRAGAVWDAVGLSHGTPAQTALRFGLRCRSLSTIEVGMAELDHLEQALAAEQMGPLPDDCIPPLEQLWHNHPAFAG